EGGRARSDQPGGVLLHGHPGRGPEQDPGSGRQPGEVPLDEPEEHPERGHRAGTAAGVEAQEVIAGRVAAVRERISRAAERAGRRPTDVQLVAVSKTQPPEAVREAFAAGLREFGENKVQEAEAKIAALADLRAQGLRWHLVGHLQANKARKAAVLFDRVHSMDDRRLAERLEQAAAEEGKVLPLLAQVDLAGEETKFGIPESRLFATLDSVRGLKSVRVEG